MIGLDQTMDTYTADPTTGQYTVLAQAGVRCRLMHVNRQPAATAADRAELGALRDLIWEPSYVLPETAQVEVESVRWNPVAGTFGAYRGPSGALVYRRADAMRAGA